MANWHKPKQPHGAAGGKRGKTNPEQHRRRATPRAAASLEKVRKDQEALDRRIAVEQEANREREAQHRIEAARRQSEAKAAEQRRIEAERAEKRSRWTLGQARALIRQGYTEEHAMRVTGYDRQDFYRAPGPEIYD